MWNLNDSGLPEKDEDVVCMLCKQTFAAHNKPCPAAQKGAAMEDKKMFEQDDLWKHRSIGMRCGKCMYFVPKQKKIEGEAQLGRCRRHAPTMSGWPAVFSGDWCGDHKLDETKI